MILHTHTHIYRHLASAQFKFSPKPELNPVIPLIIVTHTITQLHFGGTSDIMRCVCVYGFVCVLMHMYYTCFTHVLYAHVSIMCFDIIKISNLLYACIIPPLSLSLSLSLSLCAACIIPPVSVCVCVCVCACCVCKWDTHFSRFLKTLQNDTSRYKC